MRRGTLVCLAIATTVVASTAVIGLSSSGPQAAVGAATAPPVAAPAIKVAGNHIVIASTGRAVQLHGVNRPGPEYAAAEGWGIWDGATNDNASVAAIKAWNVNVVRVPLNEDSWFGINNTNKTYNGAPYRAAIIDYVHRLNANGIIAIINLHFSAPGTTVPHDQSPVADVDHSGFFWKSVALTFKTNHSVIFDLFNEPYPDNNQDTTAAWTCVRAGGTCAGVPYRAMGMQALVNIIRVQGATQPLMIAGPEYAGTLSHWGQYAPYDPQHQLIASVHVYGLPLDSPYRASSTWQAGMGVLATKVPVIIGEFGDTDCSTKFSPPLMTWADQHAISYLAWGWIVGSCANDPALVTNYNGTPTAYGAGVRTHFLSRPKSW